jgi:hypothetical protein
MEYLLGSLVTLFSFFAISYLINKQKSSSKKFVVQRSQSHLYKLLSDIAYKEIEKEQKQRQSDKFLNKHSVKVMIIEDKAYWIKDNQLYTANYVDGDIDNYSIKEVDTINMSQVELEKTMFIVEKLAEEDK